MKKVYKAIGYYIDWQYEQDTRNLGIFFKREDAQEVIRRYDATKDAMSANTPLGKIEEISVYESLEDQEEVNTAGTVKNVLSKLSATEKAALKSAGLLKEDVE